jgi:hypothetical protein
VGEVASAVLWGAFPQPCGATGKLPSLGINRRSLVVPAAPHLPRHASMAAPPCAIRRIEHCASMGSHMRSHYGHLEEPAKRVVLRLLHSRMRSPSFSINHSRLFSLPRNPRQSHQPTLARGLLLLLLLLFLISRCACPLFRHHFFAYFLRGTSSNRFLKIRNGSVGISLRPALPPELCSSAEP